MKENVRNILFICLITIPLSTISLGTKKVIELEKVEKIDSNKIMLDSVINSIKGFESFQPRVYKDPGGSSFAIGYGTQCNKVQEEITEEKAEELLKEDFSESFTYAKTMHPNISFKKLLGIACFIYNCGVGNYKRSTLKKLIDLGKDPSREWVKWCHYTNNRGKKKKSKGLLNRRQFELNLFKS